MRFAEHLRYSLCRARLVQRRRVVVRTLDYLDAEREIVDANREWKTPSSQRERRHFLDEVHGWYDRELKNIDIVLDRLGTPVESGHKLT